MPKLAGKPVPSQKVRFTKIHKDSPQDSKLNRDIDRSPRTFSPFGSLQVPGMSSIYPKDQMPVTNREARMINKLQMVRGVKKVPSLNYKSAKITKKELEEIRMSNDQLA